MPDTVRVSIKKEILHWALHESQKENEKVANRFPGIDEWIKGRKNPTFKQLQDFADFLKIPFGYLFLENPPQTDAMEAEFRSISNKSPVPSKNLKDTIADMDIRRGWMSDYRRDLGWRKLDVIKEFAKLRKNRLSHDAPLARKLLGLNGDWYRHIKNHSEAYPFLKNRMEEKGILVMQNGVVGLNNYRKLDVNEFRAFVLYDDIAPVIFINNNDTLGGKIFSLVHEYIHILFEQEDLLLKEDMFSQRENERCINQMAGELLMPAEHVYDSWEKQGDPYEQIHHLSALFKVSETALGIKLRELSLINNDILKTVINEGIKRFGEKTSEAPSGGDFYNTFRSRISPTFAEAVIRSAEAGSTNYTQAFRLLGGIRGKTYDEIKERYMPHG